MSEGVEFKVLEIDGRPLSECEMVLECNSRNYRLYVLKGETSFKAMAVEFCSCDARWYVDNIWDAHDLMVSELFRLTAYFDGVRHLEFNRYEKDMEGYIYCPNMEGLIEMLSKVREIEKEICWDCDD